MEAFFVSSIIENKIIIHRGDLHASRICSAKLTSAGIEINGPHDWDPQINNEAFYGRVIAEKNLGLGEAYMDGWWNCKRLDELLCRIIKCGVEYDIKGSLRYALLLLPMKLLNMQSRSRSHKVAEEHYDIGNDLFFLSSTRCTNTAAPISKIPRISRALRSTSWS